MRLNTFKETKTRLPMKKIRALFELITAEEAKSDWVADVNLVFTSDRRLQALNKRYRQMNRPTDVLSFNIDDPHVDGGTFGEIYISTQTARRQAARYGASLTDEYLRLFCHGLLHLFGYDHMTEKEEKSMLRRQERFLGLVE